MPIEVQGPDGTIVEFPDGTPPATIERAMRAQFGGPAQPAARPPAVPARPAPAAPAKRSPFQRFTDNVVDAAMSNPTIADLRAGFVGDRESPFSPASPLSALNQAAGVVDQAAPIVRALLGMPEPAPAPARPAPAKPSVVSEVGNLILSAPMSGAPMTRVAGGGAGIGADAVAPGIRAQVRAGEVARRQQVQAVGDADPWHKADGGLVGKALAGGATLAGQITGSMLDPQNLVGGEGQTIVRRMLSEGAANAVGDVQAQTADVGAGIQQGYNPAQTAASFGAGVGIRSVFEAAGRSPAVARAIGDFFTRKGIDPATVSPETLPPDVAGEMLLDPDIAAILQASNVDPASPQFQPFVEAAQRRRAAEAARGAAPAIVAQAAAEAAPGGQGIAPDTAARLESLQAAPNVAPTTRTDIEATLLGDRDPATIRTTTPPAAPDVIPVDAAGRADTGNVGTRAGADAVDAGMAAQRAEAEQAFRMADIQRRRVEPGIRDTQTAGVPRGPEPQQVLLDDGFPVRVVEEQGNGRVKVQRYDPRTGALDPEAVPYDTSFAALSRRNYTPEPRRAQDFGARDGLERAAPEQPRMATGPVTREPTKTYQTTPEDAPPAQGPFSGEAGRPPLPEQPGGRGPWRDQPGAERAQRFADEAAARARWEQRQQESQYQEFSRRAREQYAGSDAKTSSTAAAPDAESRFPTDEFGFVASDKGGPIRFGDQKQAAKWILNVGQKQSPDQVFEIANHPKGGFTARETGRSTGSAGEKAGGGAEAPPPRPASEDTGGVGSREATVPPAAPEARAQGREPTTMPEKLQTSDAPAADTPRQAEAITRRDVLRGGAGVAGAVAAGRAEAKTPLKGSGIESVLKRERPGVLTGSIKDVVDWLANNAKSPEHRDLARRLALGGFGDNARLEVHDPVHSDVGLRELAGVAGDTDLRGDGVLVRLAQRDGEGIDATSRDNGFSEETALHEITHAWIEARYRNVSTYLPENRKRLGQPAQTGDQFVDEFNALWQDFSAVLKEKFPDKVENDVSVAEMYASPDEMLVRALTDPEAQAFLRSIDIHGDPVPPGGTLWDKIVGAIARMLGMDTPAGRTALDKILDASNKVIKAGTLDKPDRSYARRVSERLNSQDERVGERTEPDRGTKLYSGVDPEAVNDLLLQPGAKLVKEEVDGFKEDLRQILGDIASFKANAPFMKPLETAAKVMRAVMWTKTAAMRAIAAKYPDVPEIRWLADSVGTDPGRGRNVKQTFERAVQMHSGNMAQRLDNIFGRKRDQAFERKVVDILAGRRRPLSGTREALVAQRVRALLDEQHAYLTEAGVETGYVKGKYYPRVVDVQAVLRNSPAFKEKAASVYRKMGLSSKEASEAADDWYHRIMGVTDPGGQHGTPASKFTKGRTLPPEADTILADFYVNDPRENLAGYFRQTSRAAEFTRRFGKNGEKADEAFNAMLKKGVDEDDVNTLRDNFAGATGSLYSTRPGAVSGAMGWIQTAGVLGALPRSVISSLAETLTVGVKAHDIRAGLKATVFAWADMLKIASHPEDAVRLSEFLGLTGHALNDMILHSRFDGDPGSRGQQKLVSRFFRTNMLEGVTRSQRIAALRIGQGMLRELLTDVGGTRRRASALRLLNELGIDEPMAKSLLAWLPGDGKGVDMSTLMSSKPEAVAYRSALQRFVDESIQNPTAADRPLWAEHPYGRFAYGITSFTFSFTRNVLLPTLRDTGEGIFGKGYTPEDRLRLLSVVPSMVLLGLAQTQIGEWRDNTFSKDAVDERSKLDSILTNVSRAGVFGNADPMINLFLSLKYNRGATTLTAGPYLGTYFSLLEKLGKLMPKKVNGEDFVGSNSDKTNNAEWNATKASYRAIVAPLASAIASYIPGGPIMRAGYGVGNMFVTSPDMSNRFADKVVGPRTVVRGKPKADSVDLGGDTSSMLKDMMR